MHNLPSFITLVAITVAAAQVHGADAEIISPRSYLHPRTDRFTNFRFVSPLPTHFVNAYPRRQQMGDQYLDFLGVIAIVGETKLQQADMRRIAHVLMGLIDNDQDGQPDDAALWNKLQAKANDTHRLVLYVTQEKAKYKSFDDAHPSIYHQGWSSFRDGEPLQLSNIQEELLHFLQRHLWEQAYPHALGLEQSPRSIAQRAAEAAVRNRHYVYDQDCISESGCLVPEFFFCVMTDVMPGWQGDGFAAPGQKEWRLKGNRPALLRHYPELTTMISEMQEQGKLPRSWPSFFLLPSRSQPAPSGKNR